MADLHAANRVILPDAPPRSTLPPRMKSEMVEKTIPDDPGTTIPLSLADLVWLKPARLPQPSDGSSPASAQDGARAHRRGAWIPSVLLVLVLGFGGWGAYHLYAVSVSTADALHAEQARHERTRRELYATRHEHASAARSAVRAEQRLQSAVADHEAAMQELRASYGPSFAEPAAASQAMRGVAEDGSLVTAPNQVTLTLPAAALFDEGDTLLESAEPILERLAAVLRGNRYQLQIGVHPRGVRPAARDSAAARAALLVEHLTRQRHIPSTRIAVVTLAGARRGSRPRVDLTLRPAPR